jgi:hypothetical protein
MVDENQFTAFWDNEKPNINNLLKLENEDIEELPSTLIKNIQNKLLIQNIYKRLYIIEQCFFNPQSITIENFDQLRHIPGEHWTSRIYTLFRDTHIPQFYILDIFTDEENTNHDEQSVPNTVYVQLISFRTKMFVMSKLTHFFALQPNSSINIYD